jgi:hypothetical protein
VCWPAPKTGVWVRCAVERFGRSRAPAERSECVRVGQQRQGTVREKALGGVDFRPAELPARVDDVGPRAAAGSHRRPQRASSMSRVHATASPLFHIRGISVASLRRVDLRYRHSPTWSMWSSEFPPIGSVGELQEYVAHLVAATMVTIPADDNVKAVLDGLGQPRYPRPARWRWMVDATRGWWGREVSHMSHGY